MSEHKGWIGVDLDGTLAHYDGWKGIERIGEPVPLMLERVKTWLAEGREVRIFTARVGVAKGRNPSEAMLARFHIQGWCSKHLGVELSITATKDMNMVELWDDRAVQVVPNTGQRVDGCEGPLPFVWPAVAKVKSRSPKFDKRLGKPAKWSLEKWAAVKQYHTKHGRWPTHEYDVCLGCGQKNPCKSDCPAGTGKVLAGDDGK